MDRVCTRCIDDDDLKIWIREENGPRGCDYCGTYVAPTAELADLCEYMEACISQYWGIAVEQAPWDGREGGYQVVTWETGEIIFDEIGLSLPCDINGKLYYAILNTLSDECWCDYDILRLDQDEALKLSWSKFCSVVKHKRRFFFETVDYDPDDLDSVPAGGMLHAIAQYSEAHNLITTIQPGLKLYRARPNFTMRNPPATAFGPPPLDVCQSNRMNPAGVPMFYGALDMKTAVREVKANSARVGCFQTAIPLRVLDLTKLPPRPGFFAPVERRTSMELSFLNKFRYDIMQPVDRDDKVHTEYVPSQVVTEYLRDFPFQDGKLDGVMYGSVASPGRKNIVLFIDTLTPTGTAYTAAPPAPLIFLHARSVKV